MEAIEEKVSTSGGGYGKITEMENFSLHDTQSDKKVHRSTAGVHTVFKFPHLKFAGQEKT